MVVLCYQNKLFFHSRYTLGITFSQYKIFWVSSPLKLLFLHLLYLKNVIFLVKNGKKCILGRHGDIAKNLNGWKFF